MANISDNNNKESTRKNFPKLFSNKSKKQPSSKTSSLLQQLNNKQT